MTDLSTLPVPPNCPYFVKSKLEYIGWLFEYPCEHPDACGVVVALKPHRPECECVADDKDIPVICSVAAEYWMRESERLENEAMKVANYMSKFNAIMAESSMADEKVRLWRSAMRSPNEERMKE